MTDTASMKSFITEEKPDFLIHSAAQRFPDKMQENPEQARLLNVEATKVLAESMSKLSHDFQIKPNQRLNFSDQLGGKMLYISTDYVFDGKSPPYTHESLPNPLNDYGISKLAGEKAVLKENSDNLILRMPILYGDVTYIDESAVTTLYKKLADPTKKATEMSDYEIRRPSHVSDIASIVHDLINLSCKSDPLQVPKGVYQWCGTEAMTKYDMIKSMSEAFDLDHSHIKGVKEPSPGAARPYDTSMVTTRLLDLGIQHHTPFKVGIKACLEKWHNK